MGLSRGTEGLQRLVLKLSGRAVAVENRITKSRSSRAGGWVGRIPPGGPTCHFRQSFMGW